MCPVRLVSMIAKIEKKSKAAFPTNGEDSARLLLGTKWPLRTPDLRPRLMLYQTRTGRERELSRNWRICAGIALPKSWLLRAYHASRTRSGSGVATMTKLGWHGVRASGAPAEELICDSR